MSNLTVEPDDRHGGDVRCFYCHEAVGAPHKPECVRITRKALVRAIIEYEVDVAPMGDPDDKAAEHFEFHRNEGSWCADNMLRELSDLCGENGCLCGRVKFAFVRFTGEPEVRPG